MRTEFSKLFEVGSRAPSRRGRRADRARNGPPCRPGHKAVGAKRPSDAVTRQPVFFAGAAASALAILPILAAHHLPLLDAPGHEARLAVLRDLLITGHGSPFYASDSFFLPNIAFDGIGVGLIQIVDPETAGRMFFGLTLVLTLWGVLTLNRVATGRRSFVPLVSALLLYNLISIFGFFSYAFGLALVPWALAARLKLEGFQPVAGFLLGAAFGIVLLFCHAFAFGVYAAVSAGFVLAALRGRRLSIAGALARGFELVPAVGLFVVMSVGGGGEIRYQPNFFEGKLFGIVEALTSGSLTADAALAAGLVAFILLAATSPRVRLAQGFAPGLAGLFALYLALPVELGSAANLDKRMPIALALIALSGLDIHFRRGAAAFVLASLIVAALMLKQGALASLWRSFDPVIDAAVASIAALPGGSVVMQSECHPEASTISSVYRKWQPSMTHVAALASFDDARFVASTWAIPGQQPITIKPPYQACNRLQTVFKSSTCTADGYHEQLASIRALAETEDAATIAPPLYFFIIRPPAPTMLLPEARLVAAGRDFELYALNKP